MGDDIFQGHPFSNQQMIELERQAMLARQTTFEHRLTPYEREVDQARRIELERQAERQVELNNEAADWRAQFNQVRGIPANSVQDTRGNWVPCSVTVTQDWQPVGDEHAHDTSPRYLTSWLTTCFRTGLLTVLKKNKPIKGLGQLELGEMVCLQMPGSRHEHFYVADITKGSKGSVVLEPALDLSVGPKITVTCYMFEGILNPTSLKIDNKKEN